jgi:hypothetical protein
MEFPQVYLQQMVRICTCVVGVCAMQLHRHREQSIDSTSPVTTELLVASLDANADQLPLNESLAVYYNSASSVYQSRGWANVGLSSQGEDEIAFRIVSACQKWQGNASCLRTHLHRNI